MEELFSNDIYEQMKKALLLWNRPSEYFENLFDTESLKKFFPELEELIDVPQTAEHHKEGDVWTHTMMVVDEAAKRRNLVKYPLGFMLSALCHDFGKTVCTEEINGTIHAYRHETEGLPVVKRFMERIKAEKKLEEYVLNMTELHMLPNMMASARSARKSTNKMFSKSVEPYDLMQLSICDGLGKIPAINDSEEFLQERFLYYIEVMERPYVAQKDLEEYDIEAEYYDEVLNHAHKLRLAGIEKQSALRQTLAYARKLKKEEIKHDN